MKPQRFCQAVAAAFAGLFLSLACWGQDDVFGPAAGQLNAPANQSTTPTADSKVSSSNLDDDSIVVQWLRRNPPTVPLDISRAILYMIRLERWDEVGRYLDQLAKASIDEAKALQMSRLVGLETWLKIAEQTERLSQPQRDVAKKMLDLTSAASRNASTLKNAIEQLRAVELIDRKRGVLAIQAAGKNGLAALLESIAETDSSPSPMMSEIILTYGREGETALQAALATSDRKAQERLALCAARIPGGAYMAELMGALYLVPAESECHRQIVKVLSPNGQAMPAPEVAQRYALKQMEKHLQEFTHFRRQNEPSIRESWRWSLDGKYLNFELDDLAGASLERAYQLAKWSIQLGPLVGADASLATAVVLERNYRLSPILELDANSLRQIFQPASVAGNLSLLRLVGDAARREGLLAAHLRTIQAIIAIIEKNPAVADVATTVNLLADAVKNGVPPIRYAAAIALSKLPSSQRNFDGKSAFELAKRETANLESKPLGLIVGGSSNLRDSLARQLAQLGMRTIQATSGRETLRIIQEPQPIEAIFLVDRVLEMSLSELIQRLRAYPRTNPIPMAVLTDRIDETRRTQLANEGFDAIHYSSVTDNLDLTSGLLGEMQRRSPIPSMDGVDRQLFRSHFESRVSAHP